MAPPLVPFLAFVRSPFVMAITERDIHRAKEREVGVGAGGRMCRDRGCGYKQGRHGGERLKLFFRGQGTPGILPFFQI